MATKEATSSAGAARTCIDTDGDKIGTIEEIYLDARDRASPSGRSSTPACSAPSAPSCRSRTPAERRRRHPRPVREGARSRTPRRSIPTASSPSRRSRALPPLRASSYAERARRCGALADRSRPSTRRSRRHARRVGDDTSGPNTDDAMTRSEEELRVGTDRARGRPRAAEEVRRRGRGHRRPSPCAARRSASSASRSPTPTAATPLDGPAISEEEHEVVLHEEEPVVEKRTVPKERVRLEKDVDTPRRHGLRHGPPGAHRRRRLPRLGEGVERGPRATLAQRGARFAVGRREALVLGESPNSSRSR